jgi:ATP-binding protein involved in chromosome partitioning
VVENMSGFTCSHGEHYPLFGEGGGQELADSLDVPLIASVPLDALVVQGGDEGAPVTTAHPDNPASLAFKQAAARLVELVPPAQDETCTGRIAKLVEALEAMEQPA